MNALVARHITVTGQVQGVGFRPFVYNLARRLELVGSVSNDAQGVQIRVVGTEQQLQRFSQSLRDERPAMALIRDIQQRPADANELEADTEFTITASGGGEVEVSVTPDATICQDCLNELFDPNDRRYRYPFINCTNCGPRYTLIRQLPYDRASTTMSTFELCHRCDQEYQNPEDRRFHAQPNACEECGPQLQLLDAQGQAVECVDPFKTVADRIKQGEIIAIKGIGGFHLVCDAQNAEAVARLRARKKRDQKPFALMAANPESLNTWVELTEAAQARLSGVDAPIVLCQAKDPQKLPGIAPGLGAYGVMLPHAPLHYLLFHAAAGCPENPEWLQVPQQLLLVMTSANRSGDPLLTENHQALEKLTGIADGFLVHNRDIHIRCDDSVVNGLFDPPTLIRRGRGLAPQIIELDRPVPSVLAVGAFFKNTVCVTKGDRAYVSQHIGDLDNPGCCRTLQHTVEHLLELFEVQPQAVVSDLHPDFFSSQFARDFAERRQLPIYSVQHHHAHIAAVMAEHQVTEPLLGLALDGLGIGEDGFLRGGELMRVDGDGYQQLGQLQSLSLPGGDRAAREPWRIAVAMLHQQGLDKQIAQRFGDQPGLATVQQMLDRGINCPSTSSAGRLFDGVAALLNLTHYSDYEAQAAMVLENAARRYLRSASARGSSRSDSIKSQGWPQETLLVSVSASGLLDLSGLLSRLCELDSDQSDYGAALFHRQLIDGLCHWLEWHGQQQQLNTVALAGGCFLNQLLSDGVSEVITEKRYRVYRASQLPCNDGGISLGQAYLGQRLFEKEFL
ncbi:MAG: carbamoyltransferase HypF [Motiliproteus sp.]|nr:carbamoyltransferase HypF [Motiliproteus sp.]MCW9051825.1 carbamoyltransferase HypF [Motiliproteus sp.]